MVKKAIHPLHNLAKPLLILLIPDSIFGAELRNLLFVRFPTASKDQGPGAVARDEVRPERCVRAWVAQVNLQPMLLQFQLPHPWHVSKGEQSSWYKACSVI